MTTGTDEHFLRLAFKLALKARQQGADPFGAVLVRDGTVVAQDRDRSVEASDPTYHAELAVISAYCRENHAFSLEGFTLYASVEPCMMCAGAIYWARISRVVFGAPQAILQQMTGGTPKPSCESILNMGGKQRVEVVGPLLLDEALAVFEGYVWTPRLTRHRQLFGTSSS